MKIYTFQKSFFKYGLNGKSHFLDYLKPSYSCTITMYAYFYVIHMYYEFEKLHLDHGSAFYRIELLPLLEKYDCFSKEIYEKLKECFDPVTCSTKEQIRYSLKESKSLRDVIRLFDMISEYLAPLSKASIETILFNGHAGSEVLRRCLQYCWTKHRGEYDEILDQKKNIVNVNHSVEDAEKMMKQLISGNASIDLVMLEFNHIEVTSEKTPLEDFVRLKHLQYDVTSFVTGYSALMNLIKFQPLLAELNAACIQFNLTNCQKNDKMITLINVSRQLEYDDERISINKSKDLLARVKTVLSIKDSEVEECIKLLSAVRESGPLCNFAKERNICNKEQFLKQYQLITSALNVESNYDFILNQLHGAMVVLFPFLDTSTTLEELLISITCLKKKEASRLQLLAVNSNVDLIRVCFDSTQVEY